MEIFKVENLSFTYPNKKNKTLESINFTVNQGEFVLICGKSGCGKTTLLRLLKSSLSPFGKTDGNICFMGTPQKEVDTRADASKIGFVMQNPDNQIVCDKVWHELSFGLESLGFGTNKIRTKVAEMASFFGIQNWFYKNTAELSGGQKQLLNLASVMACEPDVLILDEPTSQLDPIASQEFLNTVKKINAELGTTIILTEHRLEDAYSLADKVIVMDNGKIIENDTAQNVAFNLKSKNHDMYFALPAPAKVYGVVENKSNYPLTVKEGKNWITDYAKTNTLNPAAINKENTETNPDTVIEVKDAYFRYDKNAPDILKGLNLKVNKGEIFSILGGNGSGKTTALSIISGINRVYRGNVYINGRNILKIDNLYNGLIGYLPQNPQNLFVKSTVLNDLKDICNDGEKIQKICSLLNIEDLTQSHPYDLSGGEQQRAALAKVLLKNPQILLLDEPTKGMDAHFKADFADILKSLTQSGITILMVSHDIEFCAEYSNRCALIFDGEITSSGTSREFFKGNSFYTTTANRMARHILPDAVLADDIISACEREPLIRNTNNKKHIFINNIQTPGTPQEKGNNTHNKRTLFSVLISIIIIPLTMYIGIKHFGNRKYFLTSLLIMLETFIPFLWAFESRKPKARELVIISVLCALAVAGRGAFFMLPHFKPVAAIVIISGICFGGETGFLVGAVTAFVSNFFFGQGPWTPWQMFAYGIIGLIAGLIFTKGINAKTKIPLCIFGALACIIIYGGIMNPASLIMAQNNITFKMLLATYATGISLDIVHALATAIFLWLVAEPLCEKLERVKIKYGLMI